MRLIRGRWVKIAEVPIAVAEAYEVPKPKPKVPKWALVLGAVAATALVTYLIYRSMR